MKGLLDILGLGAKIIDKVIPDKAQQAEAKLKLMELQQQGEFKEDELRYSAINTEASSNDKWTSRARPSFMYVMYIMILTAIPFGVLSALKPEIAASVATGMKSWLAALPEELWWLFGAGYVGYTGARTFEKSKGK